jgi:hypothetical protein
MFSLIYEAKSAIEGINPDAEFIRFIFSFEFNTFW